MKLFLKSIHKDSVFYYFTLTEFSLAITENFINIDRPIKVKVKLATFVEGDSKAPFSIATTPRCWGGCSSIPCIASLYPWSLPYNAEC